VRARRLFLLSLALGLGVSAPLAARKPPMRSFADPSSIFAVEIAFNRLAREKGQWTAFRETAADDAVMFVPQKILAKDWLKGRADPPTPVQWQAHKVYISCDRRTAAATGTWQGADGAQGYFTTIWRMDAKGRWKWVLDHGDRLDTPRAESEFLEGHVAECRKGGRGPEGWSDDARPPRPVKGGKEEMAAPPDDSLRWSYETGEDGSRALRVNVWTGSAYEMVIEDRVGAAP